MDDSRFIQGLKSLPMYAEAMKQLTVNPQALSNDQKTYILTCSILLIRKYQKDKRFTSYIELAYYIILKYSLSFQDYEPLYDFSVNMGFYPIAQAITKDRLVEFESISFSLIEKQIQQEFESSGITETLDQHRVRENILNSESDEISFIAPTSFGKSSIILDHIEANCLQSKRIAIIVPTKSLLMQTYHLVRSKELHTKILLHDEMYDGEKSFIAVFTQERALRLLEKNNIAFDVMYIDEAHLLFERDTRAIFLARLIKLNRYRNPHAKIVYLSPLVENTQNLKIFPDQNIFEQRIKFNIKEPEYYEYRNDGRVYKYNRFLDSFFQIGRCENIFEYIHLYQSQKSFCYLYTPRKIEQFAEQLSHTCPQAEVSSELLQVINNLKEYVHEDFYVIDLLKKGIVYLHGKMPDNIKEYLEYKFSVLPQIRFLVANKVVLEGINLPIDSLFILSGHNLSGKDLTNLIGRVNRLDQVFGTTNNLSKLMPQIHFVNSDEFNRVHGRLENKIRTLKRSTFPDKIKNPLLQSFSFDEEGNSETVKKTCENIIKEDRTFFEQSTDPIQVLRQRMIGLGMNGIYSMKDGLCEQLFKKIRFFQEYQYLQDIHFLDRLRAIFILGLDNEIVDKEFRRLQNDKAVAYYKIFFENRKKSLKEKISSELAYFYHRIKNNDTLLYIGESYGEIPYANQGQGAHQNVYINLSTKTNRQLVNIAIIKQKIEEDFVHYKLNMFFQLMYDYGIISTEEYHSIIYGTSDPKKLQLIKMGLPINIINRLEQDNQLNNITVDKYSNLDANEAFQKYKDSMDDFYRFELSRLL